MTGLASLPWRTGRSLGRTVYARTGGGDWKADTAIGMLDTRELAEAACQAHNDALALREAALIPGSMGTRSYVVSGLGNPLSLNSSPHGAGREYSRAAAKRTFTREQLDEAMAGIEWGRSDAFLDEIPGAYKPIDVVMQDAADLVRVEHTLRQIVNVKGD